ncbi:hypothetical protein DENIS_0334 [Desulfonema ishimotonii]|uniref:N-methyl-D-aspartate receptor NMDAR2C subunit n=1 Tax=Desulfonema ishimotonii TaxID=45657 RepID=A0A401FR10_9BACT|nr:N-methyl-D-aspartate receptor NMDAR2C subunit [Desulfonema ishimotonii]GBC59395.1 hypothetical protein DENIS_0334 [Desulfonema ishimotonii]
MKNTRPDPKQFSDLWHRIGGKTDPHALFSALAGRYSEPHRAYHTLEHVGHCLKELDPVRHLAEQADEIEIALWFHDAVYDTRSGDNEEKSARWASDELKAAGLPGSRCRRVKELILATKHAASPVSSDACIMADIDLSVLGQPAAQFEAYGQQIRTEYNRVPEDIFRQARLNILREFLGRERIYATEYFRERYEASARKNLEQAVRHLCGTSA